jgi:superfamily I DNA/RNA helicase
LTKETRNIGVLSFTRAAAQEITRRAARSGRIRFIGTVHSLAYRVSEMSSEQVADPKAFAEWYGTDRSEISKALTVAGVAWATGVTLQDAYIKAGLLTPYYRFEHLVGSYLKWKSAFGFVDFDDMINLGRSAEKQPFDYLIVDEAQDLNDRQIEFILTCCSPETRLIFAGDDDQAIYTWSGANPHSMIDLSTTKEVLSQSYRIPPSVHRVAELTVNQILRRQPKVYSPRVPVEGSATGDGPVPSDKGPETLKGVIADGIRLAGHYDQLDLKEPHTALFRDNYIMAEVEEDLIVRAVPYSGGPNGRRSMFELPRVQLARAIKCEDFDRIKKLSKYLCNPESRPSPEDWITAIDWSRCQDKEYHYVMNVDHLADPLVHLSTIHGFKGREDGNIVLFAQHSGAVEFGSDSQCDFEDEVRVWYVGITRAKNQLAVVGYNRFIRIPSDT